MPNNITTDNPINLAFYMFFAFLAFNTLIAIPFINLLYKYKFFKTTVTKGIDTSKRNPLWYDHLGNTLGKPSSYGILLIPNLLLFMIFFRPIENQTLLLLIFFILFALIGLWDDVVKYFYYLKNKEWGLRASHKLLLQLLVFILATLVIFPSISLNLWGFFTLLVGSLIGVFILNSYNITDGLDGLLGSITLPVLPVYIIMEYLVFGFSALFYLYIVLFSFFIVFVYFNIKPARVTFGDVGTMGVGFLLGIGIFRYPITVISVLLFLFLIEGMSSLVQILSIKYLKKKVFVIAPLHLHLLNKGWEDTKIVQRAWILQTVLSISVIFILNLSGLL